MTGRQRSQRAVLVPAWRAGIWAVSLGLATIVSAVLAPAGAAHPADCRVEGISSDAAFPLNRVKQAIATKKLSILVVGTGSSQLGGAAQNAYPARLQAALTQRLSGVIVTVATDIGQRRTAPEMLNTLPPALAAARPDLLIWQTATVDAIQSVDPDQFSQALDKGVRLARAAGADVILMNPQYSPRTDVMIALGTYVENMRWVGVQQEVPVFDRFNLMKAWYDRGTFDLYSATKKLDMAGLVHDCIGRLLADTVVEAAKPDPAVNEKRD